MDTLLFASAYEAGYLITVRFLRSRGVRGEAEEIAQAAWARGWERRNQLRDPATIAMWVNSIALNLFRQHARHQMRFRDALREPFVPPASSLAILEVARLLQQCGSGERFLLQQYYLRGYNVRELAAQCGCSGLAVRIRLLRARRKLRAAMVPAAHLGLPLSHPKALSNPDAASHIE